MISMLSYRVLHVIWRAVISAQYFAGVMMNCAARTWNRHRSALRSFTAWAASPGRGWVAADLAAPGGQGTGNQGTEGRQRRQDGPLGSSSEKTTISVTAR